MSLITRGVAVRQRLAQKPLVYRAAPDPKAFDRLPYCPISATRRATAPIPVARDGYESGQECSSANGTGILDAPGFMGFLGFPDQIFPLPAPIGNAALPPRWAEGAVFYGIFVDRWYRSPSSARDMRASSPDTPSSSKVFYGGDLDGIRESLDHIVGLGVDAIVLTPIHTSESPHRYDPIDMMRIDERLGGERSLERLVRAAHERGLRIVLDAALTHVHERHPAFLDLLSEQTASRFAPWFRVRRFPVLPRNGATYAYYYDKPWLPWLNFESEEVREHVLEAALSLVRLGVDGLRLDAMDEVPDGFWAELRARVKRENPDLLLLGEVVVDDLARYAEDRGVDIATDFGHRSAMKAYFAEGAITADEFWSRISLTEHRHGPFDPAFRLLFFDNHDTPRLPSLARRSDALALALVYLLTRPEAAWLTYGTEVGLSGGAIECALDECWGDRLPMPPKDVLTTAEAALIAALTSLRRTVPALRSRVVKLLHAEGRQLIFRRGQRSEGDEVFVLLNLDEASMHVPRLSQGPVQKLLGVNGDATKGASTDADTFAPLPSYSARVLRAAHSRFSSANPANEGTPQRIDDAKQG